jgi:Protein of unknown function (DUF2851)
VYCITFCLAFSIWFEFLSMEEIFIQFLWRHQHPVLKNLKTVGGYPLTIHFPGIWNSGPGPDFLNAKVEWNGLQWSGHVEFHLNSKDWNLHGHHLDSQYQSVVLHIVLQGKPVAKAGAETVVLPKSEIENLYQFWKSWRKTFRALPCKNQLPQIREIIWFNWFTRMGVERLEQRCSELQLTLSSSEFKWSALLFQKWFRSFGKGKWGDALEEVAKKLNEVEFLHFDADSQQALLFQIFGLSKFIDRQHQLWAERYCLLRNISASYNLNRKNRFGRGIDDDLKALIRSLKHFWGVLNALHMRAPLVKELEVPAFVYINAIAPIQFFLGFRSENDGIMNAAIELLEVLPAEDNARVKLFDNGKLKVKNAFQSQGAIHLFSVYCSRNKCLNCSLGTEILLKNESFRIHQRYR